MNKEEIKELEKATLKFKNELREVGVKEKTIELVLKDIQEYQQELMIKKFKEMQQRMFEILKEKL